MGVHVLSGDSLYDQFKAAGIEGAVVIFRECLVDGPCRAESLEELFETRSEYLSGGDETGKRFYEEGVRNEIQKVLDAPRDTEINLWFEHELFCQVNLWFLLDQLQDRDNIFVVSPPSEPAHGRFAGWAFLEPDDLRSCYEDRMEPGRSDCDLAVQLWTAFASRDFDELSKLGATPSETFKFLGEVSQAAAEMESRPEEFLRERLIRGLSFGEAFRDFSEDQKVYGYGDLQVEKIWNRIASERT
ncbi:MAG: DUF1835 domain-containing protein [Acidobacteria bacterium]|nr:MAG: DUF1835 domain-containing protein [Acidobacteriota bacterium]REK02120.1 MAG: DUF1835 domain-containing protein [Acidobacteriota bacterium]REK14078.1 MAG: DUF1835 domain-containing protein [Acidobacteriota bacterium]REK42073.1 MAG: DUF1835 domain-containing protein [Acidobacteriota bacterium]